ncbi:MAG: hypothetical protein F4Z16_06735 [Rhodothermaceae bacterium]|nr:hypothetical protein [Rhodothermaceae bacterium]MYJ08400.1 hypothetical protein [Rhodothermaceae bacterium]
MRSSIFLALFLFVAPLTAQAQMISFDPSNMAAQIKNLAQFRAQLRQLGEQTKIAKDIRDAARRAKSEYRELTRDIDRVTRIAEARQGVVTQLNEALQANGSIISYDMDAHEYGEVFAMGRPTGDPDYALNMNERTMATVTATMSTLKVHEEEISRLTRDLDVLGDRMGTATTLEERQAIQTSITLLEAQREVQQTQLDIARVNMNGAMNAVGLDAGVNAIMNHRRDQQALRDYIHAIGEPDW